jgi:hypothetical protein
VSPNSWGRRASHEWFFRWRFAQSRMAPLGLVPTLATFVSRSAISTPPRFAINHSVCATLAVFAETHWLRTYERDQEVSRNPSLRCYTGFTYSIKSGPVDYNSGDYQGQMYYDQNSYPDQSQGYYDSGVYQTEVYDDPNGYSDKSQSDDTFPFSFPLFILVPFTFQLFSCQLSFWT